MARLLGGAGGRYSRGGGAGGGGAPASPPKKYGTFTTSMTCARRYHLPAGGCAVTVRVPASQVTLPLDVMFRSMSHTRVCSLRTSLTVPFCWRASRGRGREGGCVCRT